MRIRKIVNGLVLFACFSVGFAACTESSLPRPSAAVAYSPKAPEQWCMPNGITVMVLEDRELPLVQGALFVRSGSLWEPVSLPGVVGAMGGQMRQGGAGSLTADELDLELEKLSANVDGGFGAEYGKFGFSSLSSDTDRVFALFADVVLRPRFEAEHLAIWKGQVLEGIRRRKDDPHTIASIISTELLYGPTAYGRVLVEEDVNRLTREAIIEAHRRFVNPQGALLIVSGSISPAKVRELTDKYFGAWTATGLGLVPPPVDFTPTPGIYFVKGPFQQATITIGELGVQRLSPDYVAIEAFNEILSGNFASRLFAHIRTELGLAYAVYGSIQAGVVKGVNSIMLQTKSENVGRAIAEVYRVMEELQREPPAGKELADVQRSIENSFVFKFSSTEKLIERAALLRMLNYPLDYDTHHLDKVRSLTPDDIMQVAQKRWDLSKFVVVVVGDETAYNSLKSLKEDPASRIHGAPLRRVTFDQKLRL